MSIYHHILEEISSNPDYHFETINLCQFLRADLDGLIETLENDGIPSKYENDLLQLLIQYEYIYKQYILDKAHYIDNLY